MNRKHAALRITRMPRGGYVVEPVMAQHLLAEPLFACSDIDDALAFIKDEIGEPEEVAAVSGANPEINHHGDIIR